MTEDRDALSDDLNVQYDCIDTLPDYVDGLTDDVGAQYDCVDTLPDDVDGLSDDGF